VHLNCLFFNEKNEKDSEDFWHRKLTLKVKFWHFLTPPHHNNSQNSIISFRYVDSLAKIFLILYPRLKNSTTHIAIFCIASQQFFASSPTSEAAIDFSLSSNFGAKYLGFFSSRSLKTREKSISFAQLVYSLRKVCLLFNLILQKLKSKHTFLKKYSNWAKLTEQN
jgi:tricorn protease-like protein